MTRFALPLLLVTSALMLSGCAGIQTKNFDAERGIQLVPGFLKQAGPCPDTYHEQTIPTCAVPEPDCTTPPVVYCIKDGQRFDGPVIP